MLPDELQEMKRESASAFGDQPSGVMAGQPDPTTTESASDQTSTCLLSVGVGSSTATPTPPACETAMWEEWTQATSAGDEVSTSNFLPDLASRLSFQPSDMLATWMSSFHPLAPSSLNTDIVVDVVSAGLLDPSDLVVDSAAAFPLAFEKAPSHRQFRRAGAGALGPLSPSSPLAIQNGLLNPLGDPWDSCPQWSTVTSTGHTSYDNYGHGARRIRSPSPTFLPDHSSAAIDHLENSSSTCRYRPRHTDIFIGPNGTFESTPGGWTPQLMYDATSETTTVGSSVTPLKLMASLREAGEATSSEVCVESQTGQTEVDLDMLRDRIRTVISVELPSHGGSSGTMSSMRANCNRSGAESTSMTTTSMTTTSMTRTRTTRTTEVVWPGKHRLELVEVVDGEEDMKCSSPPLLKRPKITSVEQEKALQWSDQTLRGAELRSYYCPRSSNLAAAAEAMDIMAIGPALNTNGKPRARRGSATDPQSVYARRRREKINERLKNLQNLVPNGAKVDIVTMLDEAIHYVKFLQNQVELLKSEDCWMYATPNNYNGLDLSILCPHSRELESSAS